MLTQLMLASWTFVGICGAMCLCLTKAKRNIPVKPEEARIMLTLHKQNSKCKCRKWGFLTQKKGKVIGVQCECGYRYTQKKPIIS